MHRNGWQVEIDQSDSTLNKKVRNAQLKQFNYILVAGKDEADSNTIDVRSRSGDRIGKLAIDDFEKHMLAEFPVGFPKP